MTEQTLVLIKPDAVARGLVGAITARFEARGLQLVAINMQIANPAQLYRHYHDLVDKPYYPDIVKSMTAGPLVAQVWAGRRVVPIVRNMIGDTDPITASSGTIRADYALSVGRNIIHASANESEAMEEIKIWFRPDDIIPRDNPLEVLLYRD